MPHAGLWPRASMSPELVSAPTTSTGSSCRRRLPQGALGGRSRELRLRDCHAAGGAVRGAGGREGRGCGPGIRERSWSPVCAGSPGRRRRGAGRGDGRARRRRLLRVRECRALGSGGPTPGNSAFQTHPYVRYVSSRGPLSKSESAPSKQKPPFGQLGVKRIPTVENYHPLNFEKDTLLSFIPICSLVPDPHF